MTHTVKWGHFGDQDEDFAELLCDLCGYAIDDECECTGTVVGGDVVLIPEWAPGERGVA